MEQALLNQAVRSIAEADALLVAAGAGMGVDSGLPDFRGKEGFWRAYPPFEKLGLSFYDLADPMWFQTDPQLAWGFYGHRLNLYRAVEPHDGFRILLDWARRKPHGAWVFTSNVDGQFQKAGFDPKRIVECHGSIHHLQCTLPCSRDIWSTQEIEVMVDETTFRAQEPLPRCTGCGAVARPNILMFGDNLWLSGRTTEQEYSFRSWLAELQGRNLAIIECGAGAAIPTVRRLSEQLIANYQACLIRINLREAQGPRGVVSIAEGAAEALRQIHRELCL